MQALGEVLQHCIDVMPQSCLSVTGATRKVLQNGKFPTIARAAAHHALSDKLNARSVALAGSVKARYATDVLPEIHLISALSHAEWRRSAVMALCPELDNYWCAGC